MSRLLIVSDIHGFPENCPALRVGTRGQIVHHRLADLSGQPELSGEALHAHLFERDGIRIAARALAGAHPVGFCGLGFSAGGTALWKAVADGLRLRALVCVSSTRLRYETAPLSIPTLVLWGENDPHKPDRQWDRQIPLESKTYTGEQHDFYRSALNDRSSPLSDDIKKFLSGFESPAVLKDARP